VSEKLDWLGMPKANREVSRATIVSIARIDLEIAVGRHGKPAAWHQIVHRSDVE
jgi:hypothetical protein